MDHWLTSFRQGLRRLRTQPTFTAVVVMTLALGIGLNTALFSVYRVVLLDELPWESSERLVMIWNHTEGREELGLSEPEILDYRRRSETIDEIGAYRSGGANLTVEDRALGLWVAHVSPNLFATLDTRPLLGRLFEPREFEPGNDRVAVLSHELYRSAFGADPDVIGETILLNGDDHEVVGVLPPSYAMPTDYRWVGQTELWLPLAMSSARPGPRQERALWTVGRLAPGVGPEQARAELLAIQEELAGSFPDDYAGEGGWSLRLIPLEEEALGRIRPALSLLLAAVGIVLLLVCVNLANLFLVRVDQRWRELALRRALGAGRRRLATELLSETLVLALAGSAVALVLVAWAVDGIAALQAGNVPRLENVAIDLPIVAFTLLLAAGTSVAFGLGPALRAASLDPQHALGAGRAASAMLSPRRVRTRQVLLAAQVGLAVALLVGAGLLVQSFHNVGRVDTGFDAADIVTSDLMLYDEKYRDDPAVLGFFDELLQRVQAIPRIEEAGITNSVPFWNPGALVNRDAVAIEDVPETWRDSPIAVWEVVSPRLLSTMGVGLLEGRGFDRSDREDTAPVVIVNRAFAGRFWPDQSALGKRVRLAVAEPAVWLTVVGVAENVRDLAVDQPALPRVYVPLRQMSDSFGATLRYAALMIRAPGGDEGTIRQLRQIVRGLDSSLPLANVRTLEEHLADSLTHYRLSAALVSLFAVVALALAFLGIYGVMSYLTGQRKAEIGVRMALGANPGEVVRMVVRQALTTAAFGIAIGYLGAVAATQTFRSLLFGVRATDAWTYAAAASFVAAIALIAGYVPAKRASRVDPARVLTSQ